MFTDGEYHNLTTRRRGRLTTLGPGERTHVHPVPSIVDNRTGCIEIGGRHLAFFGRWLLYICVKFQAAGLRRARAM